MIGRFFDDCCILESGHQTQASVLYQAFRNWCERNGEKGYAANKFGGLIGKEKQLEKYEPGSIRKAVMLGQE